MNRSVAAVAAMVVLCAAFAIALSDGSDGAPTNPPQETRDIAFYGYVMDIGQETNIPLVNVTVRLHGSEKTGAIDSVNTDETGKFRFEIKDYKDEDRYYLTFEYPGYKVRNAPFDIDAGYMKLELSSSMIDSSGEYAITGTPADLHGIVMSMTMGKIFGTVFGSSANGDIKLNGAKVEIVSENDEVYVTETNNGYFQLECPYGTYTMTVTCNGFHESEPMEVSTENGTAYTLTLNESISDVFLGLDNAHSMMVISFLILAIILLCGILIARRSKEGKSSIRIENDLKPPVEDDDELRHP